MRTIEQTGQFRPSGWAETLLVFLATLGAVYLSAGSWAPTPVLHDEAAYLFQAQTFANGRLASPSPPLPSFFVQLHVLVEPSYSAKYPPGFALLLAPGVRLGLPALSLMVLAGLAAVSMHFLAGCFGGPHVARLTWLLWLSAPPALGWAGSLLSQSASVPLWCLGWLSWVAWLQSGRRGWLYGAAFCCGWLAITRPLTGVAYAVVLIVGAGVRLWRRGELRLLLLALGVGAVPVSLMAAFNYAVLGDWRALPWEEWSRQYLPSDRLGFDEYREPPGTYPAEMRAFQGFFRSLHAAHTELPVAALVGQRMWLLLNSMFEGTRWVLFPMLLVGWAAGRQFRWAMLTVVATFLIHLPYPQPPTGIYYAELLPFLAFVTALGLSETTSWVVNASQQWRLPGNAKRAIARWMMTFVVALVALHAPYAVEQVRGRRAEAMAEQRRFASRVATEVPDRSIVFVRYSSSHNVHRSLIVNHPQLDRSRWVVHDSGEKNRELLEIDPARPAFLYDERTQTFTRLR
jgi:hypothetical protein